MDRDRLKETVVFGIRPVLEVLRHNPDRILRILLEDKKSNQSRFRPVLQLASSQGIKIQKEPYSSLNRSAAGENHQGLIAFMTPKPIIDLHTLIAKSEKSKGNPLLVALDGVTDSGNLGAVIRAAEGFGVFGIILPKDRSASVDAKVFKASSGAAEHVHICRVVNLTRALSDLKKNDYWVIGLDASAKRSCTDLWSDRKMVLVLGGEEKGIRPLVRRECDDLVSIPMRGKVNSLNVSSAASVIFYQASKGSEPA